MKSSTSRSNCNVRVIPRSAYLQVPQSKYIKRIVEAEQVRGRKRSRQVRDEGKVEQSKEELSRLSDDQCKLRAFHKQREYLLKEKKKFDRTFDDNRHRGDYNTDLDKIGSIIEELLEVDRKIAELEFNKENVSFLKNKNKGNAILIADNKQIP